MCGRYTLATPDPAAVRARFPIGESVEVRRRYNIAPGDEVLAVTTDREGSARGDLLRWGLVPSWAEKPDTGLKMINARVETVSQRPAFRRAFERFRCLIIADGFYEWRKLPDGPKQPYRITRADRTPFAFAGLWSIWHGAEDHRLRTCAIVTAPANDAIAPIHDRMPVILRPDAEAAWIDAATPQSQLRAILEGIGAAEIDIEPVGPTVNDARYDGPECLVRAAEPGQAALF